MKFTIIPVIIALLALKTQAKASDSVYVTKTSTVFSEIFKVVYNEGINSKTILSYETEDESSMELYSRYRSDTLDYDCILLYNNAADGNTFLFFNHADRRLYITPGCYGGFYPVAEAIDFNGREVLLKNSHAEKGAADIPLFAGHSMEYFPYSQTVVYIRAALEMVVDSDGSPPTGPNP